MRLERKGRAMDDNNKRMLLLAIFWAPSLIIAVLTYFDVFSTLFKRRKVEGYAKRIADGDKDIYTGH